jgi:hypothetical protein
MLPAVPSVGTRFDAINIYGQLVLISVCIGFQAVRVVIAMLCEPYIEAAKAAALQQQQQQQQQHCCCMRQVGVEAGEPCNKKKKKAGEPGLQ